VLQTQALNNVGMDELFEALGKHHQYLTESGDLQRRRKARRREELLSRVEYEVRRRLTTKAKTDSAFAHFLDEVSDGKIDPHAASVKILEGTVLQEKA
jgi:LAO/AO transport system kinase